MSARFGRCGLVLLSVVAVGAFTLVGCGGDSSAQEAPAAAAVGGTGASDGAVGGTGASDGAVGGTGASDGAVDGTGVSDGAVDGTADGGRVVSEVAGDEAQVVLNSAGDGGSASDGSEANQSDIDTSSARAGGQDGTSDGEAEPVQSTGNAWLGTAKRGDSGDDVVALQERMNELGLGAGPADGEYGRRTEQAIRSFQRLVRLTPTGEADRITLNNLRDFRYDGPIMTAESDTDVVMAVQKRLAAGPFDPGVPDGEYGPTTRQAIWALEKMTGIPTTGEWGPLEEWAIDQVESGRIGGPAKADDMRWVEVDLSEQLMKVYDPGQTVPVLVSHVSSGSGRPWSNDEHSGSSITPKGDFAIQRRISGWRESSLDIGRLYNPLYFTGGIALHGALSVPLYPASHGCVRVPMHVADYLPDILPNGTPVHVMA